MVRRHPMAHHSVTSCSTASYVTRRPRVGRIQAHADGFDALLPVPDHVRWAKQTTRLSKESVYPGSWSKMRVDLCSHVMHDSVALALDQSGEGVTTATAI